MTCMERSVTIKFYIYNSTSLYINEYFKISISMYWRFNMSLKIAEKQPTDIQLIHFYYCAPFFVKMPRHDVENLNKSPLP